MFDIGWSELLVIVIVTVVVINPKDMPGIIKNIKLFINNFNKVKYDFLQSLKEIEQETVIDEIKEDLKIDFKLFSKEYLEPLDEIKKPKAKKSPQKEEVN